MVKFTELKKNMDKLQNVYLISGEDRFLCHKALELITEAAGITMPEINSVVLPETKTAEEIIAACNIYPFSDKFRLVVVKEFTSKLPGAKDAIAAYLASPMPSTILVFFNPTDDTFFKTLKAKLCHVDCCKLDVPAIADYVTQILNSNGVKYSSGAINLLAVYCNYSMQHIASETEKLVSYCAGNCPLTEDIVKQLVVQDKEYQIYELAATIASGNAQKALDMVDVLSRKGSFSIISALQNNFRRALFVSITRGTDADLAAALGVKEFAIKMMRSQIKNYTPKKLKKIIDMLTNLDADIKKGKQKEDIACKLAVVEILRLRNL